MRSVEVTCIVYKKGLWQPSALPLVLTFFLSISFFASYATYYEPHVAPCWWWASCRRRRFVFNSAWPAAQRSSFPVNTHKLIDEELMGFFFLRHLASSTLRHRCWAKWMVMHTEFPSTQWKHTGGKDAITLIIKRNRKSSWVTAKHISGGAVASM